MNLKKYKFKEVCIYLNNNCNLNCKYCFLDNKYHEEISTETLINTLEFIKHYADPKGFHLHFFGTEPLLSWNKLMLALKWIEGHAPHWGKGITSNMTLMTYMKAKLLIEHNVQVLASIDGIQEVHDKYRVFRNNKGTWEHVVYGTGVFAFQGGSYGIAMTMLPENLDNLLKNVQFLYHHFYPKPRFIALNKVVDHWATPYDSRKLYKNLKKVAEWWMEIDPNYPLQFLHKGCKSFETKHVYRPRWTCGALWGSFGIDWKGDIYPCHRMIYSDAYKIGDVHSDLDPRWIDFFRSLDFTQCHLCPQFSCGTCYVHNEQITGSIFDIPPETCKVEAIRNQLIREIYKDWIVNIKKKKDKIKVNNNVESS